MSTKNVILFLTAFLVALTGTALAQTGSNIVGTVNDADGAVLPGVSVTVANMDTGLTRVTTTSAEGRFSVSAVPAGRYKVTCILGGFAETVVENIEALVGRSVPLRLTMQAETGSTVVVTGERALIETTESDVSTAIPEELIDTLPIAERNAITLALLVPGVSGSPYFDPTKSRDNFDGVSFGGASGSENLILVDGADNNDDVVGSILQFYPQDSIQEFEVVTSRFKAEYGHTDGGVLNMVTKSGTNTVTGGGYWLFRDDKLNSRSFVQEQADLDKPPFRQNVLGGYVGGPIQQDKVHFFGNIDYTKRPSSLTTFTGGLVPSIDAQGSLPQDFDQTLFVGKISAQLNQDNYLMGRYAYQDDSTSNVNLTTRDSVEHGGLGTNSYNAFLVKHQAVLGGDKLNEVFWQINDFTNKLDSNAVGTPLEFREIFAGDSALGHNINHPQVTEQTKHQLVDNFNWRMDGHGDHDMKAGFEYQRVKVGGLFSTGQPFADFFYDSEADFLAGAPAASVDLYNGPLFDVGDSYNDIFAFFLQDDWQVSPQLTLNLGIRWDIETNDWTQKNRTFITSDPLFFGAQPETDANNIGPRLGFAYDMKGDGRSVVRGGYGLYYQQIFWNSPIRNAFFEGSLLGTDSITAPTFGPTDPFCSGGMTTGCIPVVPVPGAVAAEFLGSGVTGADPNLVTPYSHQFSIGMSTLLPAEWGLDVDYVHSRSDNQIYTTRVAGRSTVNGLDTTSFGRRGRLNVQGAIQRYNGLLLSLRKRYQAVTAQFSYTLGRGQGTVARQTSGVIDDSDAGFDRNYGPNFGQRDHLFAGSLTYNFPQGLQVGTIVKLQSGFSFTAIDPSLGDLDGDNRNDEIAAGQSRGEQRGDSFAQIDLRISKSFTIAERFKPQVFFEVFNLFNTENQKPDDVANTVTSAEFGQSSGVAGQFRQAQFSVRMDF